MRYLGRARVTDNPQVRRYRDRCTITDNVREAEKRLEHAEADAEQLLVQLEAGYGRYAELSARRDSLEVELETTRTAVDHDSAYVARFERIRGELRDCSSAMGTAASEFDEACRRYERANEVRSDSIAELEELAGEAAEAERRKAGDRDALVAARGRLYSTHVGAVLEFGIGHAADEAAFYARTQLEAEARIKSGLACAETHAQRYAAVTSRMRHAERHAQDAWREVASSRGMPVGYARRSGTEDWNQRYRAYNDRYSQQMGELAIVNAHRLDQLVVDAVGGDAHARLSLGWALRHAGPLPPGYRPPGYSLVPSGGLIGVSGTATARARELVEAHDMGRWSSYEPRPWHGFLPRDPHLDLP